MNFISVTRLRVRSARFLLPFVWYSAGSSLQAKKASGNLGVRLRKTRGLTFWTLTSWESDRAMREFRQRSPHKEAMTKLARWCDEAAFAHWEEGSEGLPSWDIATERLRAQGRLSRVLYPSEDHKAGRIVTT